MEEFYKNEILKKKNRKMSGYGTTENDQSLNSEKALEKICAKVFIKSHGDVKKHNFKSPSGTILNRKHNSKNVKLKSKQYGSASGD